MRVHHSRIASTWIIDAKHSGIVYVYRPGEYRFIVETRVGRVLQHASMFSYGSESEAVRQMFSAMDVKPPAGLKRRTRKTPLSWSKIGGDV